MTVKVLTIVGARPQFIKCAPVSRLLRREAAECLVHTGQHYDDLMSDIFFRELGIPTPDYNLGIGSAGHGVQTGKMLAEIEAVIIAERPDIVMVYGDTNSTLAGALAAAKLNIKVAHVEAGLRSFNRKMPEEVNRILTDHVSSLLLCPTRASVANLGREGIHAGVSLVGDVMYDSLVSAVGVAKRTSNVLSKHRLEAGKYILATVHRAENTDNPRTRGDVMKALSAIAREGNTIIFPMHPRTRSKLSSDDDIFNHILVTEPMPYGDMMALVANARVVVTDSGGLQKEACWLGIPCVTLRNETEWVETVDSGWNTLVGTNPASILSAVTRMVIPRQRIQVAPAAERVVSALLSKL